MTIGVDKEFAVGCFHQKLFANPLENCGRTVSVQHEHIYIHSNEYIQIMYL